MISSTKLEVLNLPYCTTARGKGINLTWLLGRHKRRLGAWGPQRSPGVESQ